eukprot:XP_014045229.1 PREDICTED: CMRF35-like molecule 5 [Salmo salar]
MVILLVPTLKIVLLLAAVWSVCTAELITVEGYEGGKAEIRCPYREEWRSHQKYLCKGVCPVLNKDKVIKTEAGENSASKGRYSLKDNREESVFIVTITNLTLKDAGRYWCGVETATWKPDHYVEINLIVSEVSPALSSPSPISMSSPSPISMSSPSPSSMSSPSPSSMSSPSPSSMSSPSPSSHNRSADSSAPRVNTDTRINREVSVFARACFPSDSLNYASVNFHQNPSCLNEARVAFSKVATSSGDYAAVNIGQSPTYSTVIYSTVSQSGEL